MITRQTLEQDLAEARRQKDQHLANANAAQGAILYIEALITKLLTEEAAPMPEEPCPPSS